MIALVVTCPTYLPCNNDNFEECYQGNCIGHAFYKACQYVTNDEKSTFESMVERASDENSNLDIF
jgi:hypothetical protein